MIRIANVVSSPPTQSLEPTEKVPGTISEPAAVADVMTSERTTTPLVAAPVAKPSKLREGWLWRDGLTPRGPDLSDDFAHLYLRHTGGQDILPSDAGDFRYLWVAGYLELPLVSDLDGNQKAMAARGLDVVNVHVTAKEPLDVNCETVRRAIEEATKDGKKLVLLGYSWGGVAIADVLARHPDLREKIHAVATLAAPYAGNRVIDSVLSSPGGKLAQLGFDKLLQHDPRALSDQTYATRKARIAEAAYPSDVPTVSLAGRKKPNSKTDGFVAVEDAFLPGAARVTATGLDHLGSALDTSAYDPAAVALVMTRLALDHARSRPTPFTTRPSLTPSEAERAAYEKRNAALVAKYPHLAAVFTDPDAFLADVRQRFAEQKKVSPKHPYNFDFSDYGLPVLRDMSAALEKKIVELSAGKRKKLREHLVALNEQVKSLLEDKRVTYRSLVELGRYVSRALGAFDLQKTGLKNRLLINLDRLQLGYSEPNVASDESALFDNRFDVFDHKSAVPVLAAIEREFVADVFHPDELRMVMLPTMSPLGTEPFMRLLSHPIYFQGVTKDPIAADGFVRPGGDFWNHDWRHTASIYMIHKGYRVAHGLSDAQLQKLRKMADVWHYELAQMISELPDPNLRAAMRLLDFNICHDQGFPRLPSTWVHVREIGEQLAQLKDDKGWYPTKDPLHALEPFTGPNVTHLLYTLLKVSGQPLGFKGGRKAIFEALEVMRQFWASRLADEQAVWTAAEPSPASG
jgi:pimeloyl-ACP methyl ester carboxylesterase